MKAIYHQLAGDVLLDILSTHSDGTVDLGREGQIIVSRCQIQPQPQPGQCTLDPKSKAEAEAKAKEGNVGTPARLPESTKAK